MENINKIRNSLKGKKTYILSVLAMIKGGVVLAITLVSGEMTMLEFFQSPELNWILAGGISATLRAGMQSKNIEVTEKRVDVIVNAKVENQ